MARSQIAVTVIDRDGVAQAAGTTANHTDDHYVTFGGGGDVFLRIVSSDAGAQTVTIVANPEFSSDGLTLNDLVIAVAAGATIYAGPFRYKTFRQPSDSNRMYVNPSVSTTLVIGAYRLTNTP